MKLQINEHPLDRTIRIVLGIALLVLGAIGGLGAPAIYGAWVVGAILLATGVVGFCPLYAILRFSTVTARR